MGIYQKSIINILRRYEVLPSGFQSSPMADAMFIYNNSKHRLKVKESFDSDYGRVGLFYNLERRQWDIVPGEDPEINALMSHLKVDDIAQNAWGRHGAPKRFSIDPGKITEQETKQDYDNFRDFSQDIPHSNFFNFYTLRNTNYIQIGGGYGLYKMARDPARLGIATLDARMNVRLRLREGFEAVLEIKHEPKPADFNLDYGADFLREE